MDRFPQQHSVIANEKRAERSDRKYWLYRQVSIRFWNAIVFSSKTALISVITVQDKEGYLRSDFFLNDLDWLRGCANPRWEEIRPGEVLLVKKVEEIVCISFFSCLTPRLFYLKPPFWTHEKNLHQELKPKKLALEMPLTSLTATCNITHSAIASQDSSRVRVAKG